MKKHLYLLLLISSISSFTFAQSYSFDDFVGTWQGYHSYTSFGGYYADLTMTIEPDGFYTETTGYFMPPYYYPNTQMSDYDAESNRFHWRYLETVYAGQYFYTDHFFEVVYFQNDTLEMHYNFWGDPNPNPDAGTLFLVRQTFTGIEDELINDQNHNRKLVKVIDMMGREVSQETTGTVVIYLYNDGTTEKKFLLESR